MTGDGVATAGCEPISELGSKKAYRYVAGHKIWGIF
jgi:hypothetical protein